MKNFFQVTIVCIVSAFCGFLVRSWCFSDGPEPVPYFTSDRDDYLLTGRQYEQLKREALKGGGAEAAVRISNYYSRYEHDPVESAKWLMLAEKLGAKGATYNLSQIDEAVRSEALEKFNAATSNPGLW